MVKKNSMYNSNCTACRCDVTLILEMIIVQVRKVKYSMLLRTIFLLLFYGRVEKGESNDPCLLEVKGCINQKLIPFPEYFLRVISNYIIFQT